MVTAIGSQQYRKSSHMIPAADYILATLDGVRLLSQNLDKKSLFVLTLVGQTGTLIPTISEEFAVFVTGESIQAFTALAR